MPATVGKVLLLIDAREPTEVNTVCIEITRDTPLRIRRALARNADAGKTTFSNVYFDDGAEGTDGLVEDDSHVETFEEFCEQVADGSGDDNSITRVELIGARIDFCITWISA